MVDVCRVAGTLRANYTRFERSQYVKANRLAGRQASAGTSFTPLRAIYFNFHNHLGLSPRLKRSVGTRRALGMAAPEAIMAAVAPQRSFEPRIGRSVSLDHAAELLGVSRRTIYNRIRDGRLQTIRTIGGSQRVLLDSVIESRERTESNC